MVFVIKYLKVSLKTAFLLRNWIRFGPTGLPNLKRGSAHFCLKYISETSAADQIEEDEVHISKLCLQTFHKSIQKRGVALLKRTILHGSD